MAKSLERSILLRPALQPSQAELLFPLQYRSDTLLRKLLNVPGVERVCTGAARHVKGTRSV